MAGNAVHIEADGLEDALDSFNDMIQAVDDEKWVRSRLRYYSTKHMIPAMRSKSLSTRLERMISVTTAKKNAVPPFGVRIGVVRNDPGMFPDFSAQALASVIEHGTSERFRELKTAGVITGRGSTGSMPAAPFLRPGWDSTIRSFISDVETTIEKRVQNA